MDYTPISGNEPLSVILSQKSGFKRIEKDGSNMLKQGKTRGDDIINPQNNNFMQSLRCFNANKMRYWPGL